MIYLVINYILDVQKVKEKQFFLIYNYKFICKILLFLLNNYSLTNNIILFRIWIVTISNSCYSQSVDKALSIIELGDRSDQILLNHSLDFVLVHWMFLLILYLQIYLQFNVKREHLITELVHQRNLICQPLKNKISLPKDFEWLYQIRLYFNASVEDPLSRLTIHMANAQFFSFPVTWRFTFRTSWYG